MDLHHPGTNQMLLLYANNLDSNLPVRHFVSGSVIQTLYMHIHPDAEMVYSGIFGQGSGLALHISAGCVGNEPSLLQCPPQDYYYYYYGYYLNNNNYAGQYYYTCSDHANDIGVRCTPGMWR